jgi:hypothetical protein
VLVGGVALALSGPMAASMASTIALLEPPSAQQASPGDWLRMSVALADGVTGQPSLALPAGWSVLVPPKIAENKIAENKTAAKRGGSSRWMTAVIDVPANAPAGDYAVEWRVGQARAVATVTVLAQTQLSWGPARNAASKPMRHEWWAGAPWSASLPLRLTGNSDVEVAVEAHAPAGFDLHWSPARLSLRPGHTANVALDLQAQPRTRLWPGQRVALTLSALDMAGVVLARERVVLTVVGQAPTKSATDWRIETHQRLALAKGGDWWVDEASAGVSGSGQLDAEQQQRVSFALNTERRLGRWLAFRVYRGERLGLAPTFGPGARLRWRPNANRAGRVVRELGAVVVSDARWRYRGARVALSPGRGSGSVSVSVWSRQRTAPSDPVPRSDQWWRGAYRLGWGEATTLALMAAHHRGRWAGAIDGRWEHAKGRIELGGQWVPNDRTNEHSFDVSAHDATAHPSGAPSGARWGLGLVQRDRWGGHWQGGLYWARALDGSRSHRTGRVSVRWPVSNTFSWRVGAVATSDPTQSSDRAWLGWQTRWDESRWGEWRWRARLATDGPVDSTVRWRSPHGLSADLRYRPRTGLGWGLEARWGSRWRLAVGRRARRVTGLVAAADGLDSTGARTTRQHTQATLAWHDPNGHQWGLSVQHQPLPAMTSDATANNPITRVWLTYRWRHRWQRPAVWGLARAAVAGRVVAKTADGPRGVADAVVRVGAQSTRTDAQGRYRFHAIEPGQHRVRLDSASIEAVWMAEGGWQHTPTARPGQTHTLNWTLVEAGSLQAVIEWPANSPAPARFAELGAVWSLTCIDCPAGTPARLVRPDDRGRLDVERLQPGRWRGRLVSGTLPSHHHWPAPFELSIEPGRVHTAVWPVAYRPPDIRWAPTVPVQRIDAPD